MKPRVFLFALSVLCGALGCAPAPKAAAPQDGPHYLAERQVATDALSRAYGEVKLRSHPQLGTLASLEFAQPPPVKPPRSVALSTAVRDLCLRYRALFGVAGSDTLDYDESTTDALGLRHISYVQQHAGVKVWGSRVIAHLRNEAGIMHLVRLHAHLFPLPTLNATAAQPALAAEAARQQALNAARLRVPASSLSGRTPALYYLPADSDLYLVYRVEVYGQAANQPVRWAYFIDAQDGAVRLVEDLVAHIDVTVPAQGQGRGALGTSYALSISQRGDTYYLQDPTRGDQRTSAVSPFEKIPGRTVSSDSPERWDEAPDGGPEVAGLAVEVHAHLAALWDYFAVHHGRFGWDGGGHGLVAVVHLGERENLALFDGERVLFGDGDGLDYAPLGAAFDVVAHEYVHAVTRASAELAGMGESGALAEGFADLMACLIEQSVRPQAANWTIGEEIFHPGGQPGALSDLAEPHNVGQASSLAEYVADAELLPGSESWLAHRNGGIVAHAGYLAAQTLGCERTAAIVYRALTTYLLRYAGFADAADALIAASTDLYGEATAMHASLAAVGL